VHALHSGVHTRIGRGWGAKKAVSEWERIPMRRRAQRSLGRARQKGSERRPGEGLGGGERYRRQGQSDLNEARWRPAPSRDDTRTERV
jgi:hypothetical protein